MGQRIDYVLARRILEQEFQNAEQDFQSGIVVVVPQQVAEFTARVFSSSTQAYREALVGCALTRIIDPEIDIRLPYMKQGANAFNGRTLDERVINPFLHEREIPCSKGPYLSAFRRSVRFIPETAHGLRDQEGYLAFLNFIEQLEQANTDQAKLYLRHLLHAFVELRETANIRLARVHRLSVEQYHVLISGLLGVPSGGLFPVLFSVAMFHTIRRCFDLNWIIEWQEINVADRPAGAGGDITVSRDGSIVLVVEVTEREIDEARVHATFNTKIAPRGIEDYLFFFSGTPPTEEARERARQYFARGYDINFVSVEEWLVNVFYTIGARCRSMFHTEFVNLLDRREVPAYLKLAWNDQIRDLL